MSDVSSGTEARLCAGDLFFPDMVEPEDVARIKAAIETVAQPIREECSSLHDACNHLSMLVVELSNQLSDENGGYQVEWRPIETAPRDGELIWVYCPSAHGLSEMVSLCCWHKDGGFTVDELRHPTLWFPILQPDHPNLGAA